MSNSVDCEHCNSPNKAGRKTCHACGEDLPRAVGESADPGAKANYQRCEFEMDDQRCPLPGTYSPSFGAKRSNYCGYHANDGDRVRGDAQRSLMAQIHEDPEAMRRKLYQTPLQSQPKGEDYRQAGESLSDYQARQRQAYAQASALHTKFHPTSSNLSDTAMEDAIEEFDERAGKYIDSGMSSEDASREAFRDMFSRQQERRRGGGMAIEREAALRARFDAIDERFK